MKNITIFLVLLILLLGISFDKSVAQGLELKWRSPDSLHLDIFFRNIQYTTSAFDMNGDGRNEIPLVKNLGASKILQVWDFGLNEIVWEFEATAGVNLYGFFDLDLDSVKEALILVNEGDGEFLVSYDWQTGTILNSWADSDPNLLIGNFIIAILDFVDAPVLVIQFIDRSVSPFLGYIEVWGSPKIDLLATGLGSSVNYNPQRFQLNQNYPNPFNTSTTISFSLNENSEVSIRIFNLLGQRIRTLVNQEMPIGKYDLVWDGKNDNGGTVASGQYSYQLIVNDEILTKKMILIK